MRMYRPGPTIPTTRCESCASVAATAAVRPLPALEQGRRAAGAPGPTRSPRRPRQESACYSYRYFSESASACSMSAIVSSGIRSWASVTSAEVGWASVGSHCSGFQAPLRRSDLGQCG